MLPKSGWKASGQSSWADRDILKLANACVKYMRAPLPFTVAFRAIEQVTGLDRGKVENNFRLMAVYGAVETYDCAGEAVASIASPHVSSASPRVGNPPPFLRIASR